MLSREEVERALPASLKSAATQQLTDAINNAVSDPEIAEQIRNNFISYTGVLKDGKFKTEDYLHAIQYVSYKLMGFSNKESYERTFPQRLNKMIANGVSTKDQSAYIAAYARGKLVNLILEQSMIPTWVLNQDIYQKAINHQFYLMENAQSERVQQEAANSLLTHLKKPEIKEFQVSMDLKESSGMNELKAHMRELAEQQARMIEAGVPTKLIASQPILSQANKDIEEAEFIEAPAPLESPTPVEKKKWLS